MEDVLDSFRNFECFVGHSFSNGFMQNPNVKFSKEKNDGRIMTSSKKWEFSFQKIKKKLSVFLSLCGVLCVPT